MCDQYFITHTKVIVGPLHVHEKIIYMQSEVYIVIHMPNVH
jgi:hypothetical protein